MSGAHEGRAWARAGVHERARAACKLAGQAQRRRRHRGDTSIGRQVKKLRMKRGVRQWASENAEGRGSGHRQWSTGAGRAGGLVLPPRACMCGSAAALGGAAAAAAARREKGRDGEGSEGRLGLLALEGRARERDEGRVASGVRAQEGAAGNHGRLLRCMALRAGAVVE